MAAADEELSQDRMDALRRRIQDIIDALIVFAGRNRVQPVVLRKIYEILPDEHRRAGTMSPTKAIAYDELFGFGANGRKYLFRGTGRPSRSIRFRHIARIRATIEQLGITAQLPPVADDPSTWLPFLDFTHASIVDVGARSISAAARRAPGRREVESPSASEQLLHLLREASAVQPLGVELVPSGEQARPAQGGPSIRVRRIGPSEAAARLRPGPHQLTYASAFPPAAAVHLLGLEHDRGADEWVLINGVPEARLSVRTRYPPTGRHDAALNVQPAAGIFDLFLVAAAREFGEPLSALVEEIAGAGSDGLLTGGMLPSFAEALAREMERLKEDVVAGCFTYRVAE